MVTIPSEIQDKMNEWFRWRSFWSKVHIVVGLANVALAAVVAALVAAKSTFLTTMAGMAFAAVPPMLAFLATALRADVKGNAFERAAREIEKAIADVRGGAPEKALYDAEKKGIDILNG